MNAVPGDNRSNMAQRDIYNGPGVRRVVVVNNRRRELLYLVYFIFVFIAVRIWIIAVDSKSVAIISVCAGVTLGLLCAIYYRQFRLNRLRERHMELLQMNLDNFMRETTNDIEASPSYPIITQEMIDSLESFRFSSTTKTLIGGVHLTATGSDSFTTNPLTGLTSIPPCLPGLTVEEDSSKEICVICLANYEENEEVTQLRSCHHHYHRACITEWLLSTNGPGPPGRTHRPLPCCPLCKLPIEFSGVTTYDGTTGVQVPSSVASASEPSVPPSSSSPPSSPSPPSSSSSSSVPSTSTIVFSTSTGTVHV